MTSISLGLPEIPTGYKFTKPFTYYKGNDLDFSLGKLSFCGLERMQISFRNDRNCGWILLFSAPVASVAPSERETITRESDVDSTLHVTIPTIPSERDDLEYIYRRRCPVRKVM
jgi:hypothetical protein